MKKFDKILGKALRPLRDEIALVYKRVRQEFIPVKSHLDVLDAKVEMLGGKVDELKDQIIELNDKSDSALVDIHQLQKESKAIWVKLNVIDERTDRKIKEVREDLGLQGA